MAFACELAEHALRPHLLRHEVERDHPHDAVLGRAVRARTARHPQLQAEQVLIDALAAMVVLNPGRFDVIVASNLFGDILSDLAAAVAGSIGIAPVRAT